MTLLVIHSHGKVKDFVFELFPWYKGTGFDILGVHAEDEPHSWPPGIRSVAIGKGGRQLPHDHLCRRLVDTFRHLLSPQYEEYSDFLVTEYDCMFLNPPPPHPGGLFTMMAGPNMAGFKCKQYFHPPWWADRETAKKIVEVGDDLIRKGDTEQGSTDCFLGLVVDVAGINWTNTLTWTCQNGGDGSDLDTYLKPFLEEFLKKGTWFVHGIKTRKNKELVLSILKDK